MRILLDTNIILDIALEREPFVESATRLFKESRRKNILLCMTSTTITDLYYVHRKVKGKKEALLFIRELLQFIDVISVDKDIIVDALNSEVSDFEDAIQVCSAKKESITTIVTRDESDFIKSGFSEVLLADGLERVLLRPGKNWNEASVPLLSHSLFIKLFEGQEFRSGFVGCFFGISGFTFHIFK